MTAHWFVCAVCGERGGCDGQDEDGRGDDGEHVHFRQECWEVGPPTSTSPNRLVAPVKGLQSKSS